MSQAVLPSQESIDREFAEIMAMQLVDVPPTQETYGRSLSTIKRLGNFMLGHSDIETIQSPEAQQAKVEFFTSVEEGFGTDMELGGGLEVRDFDVRPVIDGKVMAKDLKTPVSDMTNAGLICAEETLMKDERFRPQYVRSIWDHDNALKVDAMARGDTSFNTRIIVSPFPEEAAAISGNDYWRNIGYVPHLKRGFVQLYHLNNGGELVAGSLSFDGSHKSLIKSVLAKQNVSIPDEEFTDNYLKYAVEVNLSEDEAKRLAIDIATEAEGEIPEKTTNTVDVTHKYKSLMEKVFNESYIHICESSARGKQTRGLRKLIEQFALNADSYNDKYKYALLGMQQGKSFSRDETAAMHEILVYSTIEMMRSLHLNNTQTIFSGTDMVAFTAQHMEQVNTKDFQKMLGGFGAEGAKNNRTYSACGLSINLGEEAKNPQKAFGGADNEKSEKKWMNCPHCKARVFGDPCAKVLTCSDCRAFVVNGVTWSKGNGGESGKERRRKARQQRREERRKRREERRLERLKSRESAQSGLASVAMMGVADENNRN